MSLVVHNRRSPCLTWGTYLLGMNGKVARTVSPVFNLWDSEWSLVMNTVPYDDGSSSDSSDDETCYHTFFLSLQQDVELRHDFRVMTFVQFQREADLVRLGDKEVSFSGPPSSQQIWRGELSHYFDGGPQLVQFVFQFDRCVRFITDLESDEERGNVRIWSLAAEDRCIQTPSYLDRQPCLDSLSNDLKKLLDEAADPDIRLQCGDREVPAHRNVLCARSEVFQAMLQNDMLEKRTGTVKIEDMELPVLEEFLRYLYSGTLSEMTVELATQLYQVGDKYAVTTLKQRCADFLLENATRRNACGILALADRHNGENFKESIIKYILKERVMSDDSVWIPFSNSNLALAHDVLYRAFQEIVLDSAA